jgi:hypothetical protein
MFITKKKLWEPEAPDEPEVKYKIKNRASVSAWKAYDSAVERRDKESEKFEDDKIRMFNVIMGQLSNASKSQLKQFNGWDELLESHNPLDLWNLIEATHLIPIAGCDTVTAQAEGMKQYNQLQMANSDTIDMFFEKFERRVDALESVNHPGVPELVFQALDFADKLNYKYDEYKKHMKYEIASGVLKAPTTPREVYEDARTWTAIKGVSKSSSSTEDKTTRTAYVTDKKKSGKKSKDKEAKDEVKSGESKSEEYRSETPPWKCHICDESGHGAKTCPFQAHVKNLIKNDNTDYMGIY